MSADLIDWLIEDVGHPLERHRRRVTHVPTIYLTSGPVVWPSLGLTLANLRWELWEEWDHWFALRPKKYASSMPTFAVFHSMPSELEHDEVMDICYVTLTFNAPIRLQHAKQSMSYWVGPDGSFAGWRNIGYYGREPILRLMSLPMGLPDSATAILESLSYALARNRPLLHQPELRFAIETLSRAALEGVDVASDATLCSVALEELVMSGRVTQLAKTFVRRVGELLSWSGMAPPATASAIAAGIYELRGSVLHGTSRHLDLDDDAMRYRARRTLACAVILISKLIESGELDSYSPAAFGHLLDCRAAAREEGKDGV